MGAWIQGVQILCHAVKDVIDQNCGWGKEHTQNRPLLREPHEHRRGHDSGLEVERALGERMLSLQNQCVTSEAASGS